MSRTTTVAMHDMASLTCGFNFRRRARPPFRASSTRSRAPSEREPHDVPSCGPVAWCDAAQWTMIGLQFVNAIVVSMRKFEPVLWRSAWKTSSG